MKILIPLLSGKEDTDYFIDTISKGADEIILLQIIDRDFMKRTSTAMGEVMHFSSLMTSVRKKIGLKRKKCTEITEWGATIKKILSIAFIQKVDKVVFVEQTNQFFEEILIELKKNKIKYETIKVDNSVKKAVL
ncbi:MAG: hypothetical protein WC915_00320 [archaeon]|jgi:ABC-type uncharacterized transport system fused permease/ATPase subunit